jgi:N-acetylglucosamine-6-phosphate deacetylase
MEAICLRNATLLSGYAKMEKCGLLIEDGRIVDVFLERRFGQKTLPPGTLVLDVAGCYVSPGFIDTHIHGFAGFGTEDLSADSIVAMSEHLGRYGVTSFFPTIYPMARDDMLLAIKAVVAASGRETGARIAGIHLEGPFLSPARLGVQRPEFLSAVDIDFMKAMVDAGEGKITNMTVAPELKGMRELALYCLSQEIVLQAGHTDATYENMVEGMQAGILHSTHFFNAMSRLHHRDPGAVGAILIQRELSCEIIADGHHVHPELVKLLVRDKPTSKIVLVTDALKPTEQKVGPLFANNEEVELRDGFFKRLKDDVIAGSALTMLAGVKNLADWGIPLEDAVEMASLNPARVLNMGLRGQLTPGYHADISVFDKNFSLKACLVGGRFVHNEF